MGVAMNALSSPAVEKVEPPTSDNVVNIATSEGYWHELITEEPAAEFLNLTRRKMQKDRQDGVGPKFIRLSARCIRYRRADLRAWAEARLRKSTSDPGSAAA